MNTPSLFLRAVVGACAMLVMLLDIPAVAQRGVPSDGRDFYIGFLPPQITARGGSGYFAFIGSFTGPNKVLISYFTKDGKEYVGQQIILDSGQVKSVPLDRYSITPEFPGEKLEFKAAHIRSNQPISVQLYHEGFAAAGMALALPTSGLGTRYSVAAYNDRMEDNVTQFNFAQEQKDSSSGEFLIIATEDNTLVTFTPNSTTIGRQEGKNYGPTADRQTPHPKTLTFQRGQVYWVRSLPWSDEWDISSTTVMSNKPIAVYGGHEKTFINNPYPDPWSGNDNECRDYIFEQMIPEEAWESEGYHSIPFEDPLSFPAGLLKNSFGDLYRVFTLDPLGAPVSALVNKMGSSTTFTIPQMFWEEFRLRNIENSIDIRCEDSRKIYVVMYDYFQGENYVHGQPEGTKGGGDILAAGGGPKPLDSRNYIEPKEMNIIPFARWTNHAIFKVPPSSNYRGGQYIKVITYVDARDKMSKIKVRQDRGVWKQLDKLGTVVKTFPIPNRPDLRGWDFRAAQGSDYMITGTTPFIAYQHGTSSADKQNWGGYGAPTNGYLGPKTEAHVPRINIVPACSEWTVTITDALPDDLGLADVYLLNDPSGILYQPASTTKNMILDPADPQFIQGTPQITFTVRVINPKDSAHGSLYVLDRSGNDTVYTFDYFPPKFEFTPRLADMQNILNCTDSCAVFTFKNLNEPNAKPIVVEDIYLKSGQEGFEIKSITPSLPISLTTGQSTSVRVCYKPADVNTLHLDSLIVKTDCLSDTVGLQGSGITPLIYAEDIDFGPVLVGETKCKTLRVWNEGKAPLELTKDWVLHYPAEFSFPDATKLPMWLQPGTYIDLQFCYTPQQVGSDSTTNDWGTNLCTPFEHQRKDYSILTGAGVFPGILWDRLTQKQNVVCEEADTVRVVLFNNQSATEGNVKVFITGPDAGDFAIIDNQYGYNPLEGFSMDADDSLWVDIQFKPDLNKGYGNRYAQLVAVGETSNSRPVIDFTGIITYAGLTVDKTSFDFGEIPQNQTMSQPAVLTNDGTADLTVATITVSNPDFSVTGIAIGDVIPAGGTRPITINVKTVVASTSATITITGQTKCPPPITMTAQAITGHADALGTGGNYPATWIDCRENMLTVHAVSTGTKPVTLRQVSIVSDVFHPNFDQFEFAAGGTTVTPNVVLNPGDSAHFNIYFRPTLTGPISAIVQYDFDSSQAGGGMPFEKIDFLFATGKLLRDTITALAPTGYPYTAKTNASFDVPVRLVDPMLPADAEIYGYEFKLTWKRDLFEVIPTQITAPPGYILSHTMLPYDGSGNETMAFHAMTTAPITDLTELADVPFQLMIARDTLSDFIVSDGLFLGSDGNPLCYTFNGHIPGSFVPQDFCGDKTLRDFLWTGVPLNIISVSPNPVSGRGEIVLASRMVDQPITIEIYDMLGVKQMTVAENRLIGLGTHTIAFSTEGLSSGAYSIRIITPRQVLSKTLLVRR